MKNINQVNICNINKIIKYILMTIIIILCLRYIPDYILKINEIIIIGVIISIFYAILDFISPTVKIYNNNSEIVYNSDVLYN